MQLLRNRVLCDLADGILAPFAALAGAMQALRLAEAQSGWQAEWMMT